MNLRCDRCGTIVAEADDPEMRQTDSSDQLCWDCREADRLGAARRIRVGNHDFDAEGEPVYKKLPSED